jgi:hypothetical protein
MLQLNNTKDLKTLRAVIEESLSRPLSDNGLATLPIEALLDFKIKCGNIKFEGDGSSCKVQLTVERKNAKPQEERHWEQYADSFGLPVGALHKEFTRRNGEKVVICGLCPNRPKFPILVRGWIGEAAERRFLITLAEVLQHKEELK